MHKECLSRRQIWPIKFGVSVQTACTSRSVPLFSARFTRDFPRLDKYVAANPPGGEGGVGGWGENVCFLSTGKEREGQARETIMLA